MVIKLLPPGARLSSFLCWRVAGRGRLNLLKLEAGVFIKLPYFPGDLSTYITKFGVKIYFRLVKAEIFKFTHRHSGKN